MISIGSGTRRPLRRKASPAKRHRATIQGTKPERALYAHLPAKLRAHFVTQGSIPGHRSRPDLIARGLKIAVYIDGCRWHGCLEHGGGAFSSARDKDARISNALVADGWMVLRVWEHENYSVSVKVLARLVAGRLKSQKLLGGTQ